MAKVTTYNLTIDDTSSQIVYLPPTLVSATPDLLGGWNEYYNGTGFSSHLGETGLNASWHVTSRDGAALSIAFTGVFDCLSATIAENNSSIANNNYVPKVIHIYAFNLPTLYPHPITRPSACNLPPACGGQLTYARTAAFGSAACATCLD